MIRGCLLAVMFFYTSAIEPICAFYLLKNNSGHNVLIMGDLFAGNKEIQDFVLKNVSCITKDDWPVINKKINCFVLAGDDSIKKLFADSDNPESDGFISIKQLLCFHEKPSNNILNLRCLNKRDYAGYAYLRMIYNLDLFLTNNKSKMSRLPKLLKVMLEKFESEDVVDIPLSEFNADIQAMAKITAQWAKYFKPASVENKLFMNLLAELDVNIKYLNEFFANTQKHEMFGRSLIKVLMNERQNDIYMKFQEFKSGFNNFDKIQCSAAILFEILKDRGSGIDKTFSLAYLPIARQIVVWLKSLGYEITIAADIKCIDRGLSDYFSKNEIFTAAFADTLNELITGNEGTLGKIINKRAGQKKVQAKNGPLRNASKPIAIPGSRKSSGRFVEDESDNAQEKIECANCGIVKTEFVTYKVCSHCNKSYYCSSECQKADATDHKVICKVMG